MSDNVTMQQKNDAVNMLFDNFSTN